MRGRTIGSDEIRAELEPDQRPSTVVDVIARDLVHLEAFVAAVRRHAATA